MGQQETDELSGHLLDAATLKRVYQTLKCEWFTVSLRPWRASVTHAGGASERLALDGSATHHRGDWEGLTPGVAFTSFDRVSEG